MIRTGWMEQTFEVYLGGGVEIVGKGGNLKEQYLYVQLPYVILKR